jgi:hypothetical protein
MLDAFGRELSRNVVADSGPGAEDDEGACHIEVSKVLKNRCPA